MARLLREPSCLVRGSRRGSPDRVWGVRRGGGGVVRWQVPRVGSHPPLSQELLFFSSVGDIQRCKRLIESWKLNVSDPDCCDYDYRTPLHLAASEGAWLVTKWLIEAGAQVNALDRFNRTPLEDAVRGDFLEVAKLLIDSGGMIQQRGKLMSVAESELSGLVNLQALGLTPGFEGLDLDPEWEIDPQDLRVLEKLGQGEFGTVFKAKLRGSFVAVKVLNSSDSIALGDFRTEIGILRRVHHPNAVQMLGACTKSKPFMLVTEYVPGGSLANVFRMDRSPSLRRVVEMSLDVSRGMAYLHSTAKGIIHRDLKPSNILIGGSYFNTPSELIFHTGIIKLGDFGLSKSLPVFQMQNAEDVGANDMRDTYHLTGGTGSYRYMAPEVYRHEPYNNKVDVYSFGMILYQLMEGVVPFNGTKPIQAAFDAAQQGRRPDWRIVNSLPEPANKVKALAERCWDSEPMRRPTFEEIADHLDEILAATPPEDPAWLYGGGGGAGGGGGGGCGCNTM